MSARQNKASDDRSFCPAASRNGRRCDFAVHPGAVHWTWVDGELQQWQSLPEPTERWVNLPATEDPLRDAPQVLIDASRKVRPETPGDFNPLANIYRDPKNARRVLRGMSVAGFFVDEMAYVAEQARQNPKGHEMQQHVQDLLARGRAPEPWLRPLVEATSIDGRFAYGLLETPVNSGFGAPVVHETMPDSGGVPTRVVVHRDSISEVLVAGHRGGCAGDCCRDGYSEETSYPECWTWDQVKSGIAERYRAWKNWAL